MIGAIIGAGLSAVGSIVGSIMQSRAAAKAAEANERAAEAARAATRDRLAAQQNVIASVVDNQRASRAAYEANLSAPRYAMKAVLDQTAEKIRQRNAARRGRAKLGMQTTASAQAGTAQDLEALGNAEQMAVTQGLDERRQARLQQAQNDAHFKTTMAQLNAGTQDIIAGGAAQQAAYQQQQAAISQQKAQATAQAVSGITSAAGSLATSIGSGKTRGVTGADTPATMDTPATTKTTNPVSGHVPVTDDDGELLSHLKHNTSVTDFKKMI